MKKHLSDLSPEQKTCIDFMREGEDSLICADVGTGKTVMALTAAQHALKGQEVTRWLVVAPLLVATDTWSEEAHEWSHLENVTVGVAHGTPKQRMEVIDGLDEIVAINYENIPWLLEQYPKVRGLDTLPFDGIILDEIDKMKTSSSSRFKALRKRVSHFHKRIGLTGSVVPNDLLELWGQVFLVDGGQTFGKSYYKWRVEYFYPTDFKQYNWVPKPGTREALIEAISDLVFRVEAVGLPEVVILPPEEISLPAELKLKYAQLDRDFILPLENDQKVDAGTQAVLSGKLQQMLAGFNYVEDGDPVWHSYARFDWLDELLNTLSGEQVLVFYHFKEELAELRRRYPKMTYLGEGVKGAKARDTIADWNSGETKLMALHPASAGHGLNLQKSHAHHIAFLTMPWSGGLFKQVTGRLARRGNEAKKVYVYSAVFEGDLVDTRVFETATSKLENMESFLGELVK